MSTASPSKLQSTPNASIPYHDFTISSLPRCFHFFCGSRASLGLRFTSFFLPICVLFINVFTALCAVLYPSVIHFILFVTVLVTPSDILFITLCAVLPFVTRQNAPIKCFPLQTFGQFVRPLHCSVSKRTGSRSYYRFPHYISIFILNISSQIPAIRS